MARISSRKLSGKDLRADDPVKSADKGLGLNYSPEALEIMNNEGPKYQYGTGCLSDGVIGEWMARACGLGEVLDNKKVAAHLRSVFRFNFKKDLSEHANPQRSTYALGNESGLVLCTWPRGGALSLPFPYSDEVWTGIEYQVASHLMMIGETEKGVAIVKALRARYDGRVRNPYDEFECGHWYARALASFAMIQGLTGVRYDAVEKTLELKAACKDDLRCFIATASGFGTVTAKKGKVSVEVKHGSIDIQKVRFI